MILCGRTDISLRGHRDDSVYHPSIGEYSRESSGNFVELLNYAVRRGDLVLKNHLESCPKNASYISKHSQNEIINCCGKVISEEILTQVRKVKFFTIIADECSDSSYKEQLSLVIRYVNESMDIREDFLHFLHCCEGLSGQGLFKALMECIKNDLNLNIMDCRGQAYDGAGAVARKNKDLASLVCTVNSKAIYTHCFSHVLNLSIQIGCTVPVIRNMLGQVKDVCYFFKFLQGRIEFLENSIDSKMGTTEKKKKLKDVCRTQWVERVKGLSDFEKLFPAIVDALERMEMNVDRKVSNENVGKAGKKS